MTITGRIATLIATLGLSVLAINHYDKSLVVDDFLATKPLSEDTFPKPIYEAGDTFPKPIYEAEDVLVRIDQKEFECMRLNIFHEARNQTISGQEAVAQVTLNRTRVRGRFPDTVCGVVYQRAQFSWTHTIRNHAPNLRNPIEAKAWEIAGEIAMNTLRGEVTNRVGDATFYHATYVSPGWASSFRMKRIAQIGSHVFYKDVRLHVSSVS